MRQRTLIATLATLIALGVATASGAPSIEIFTIAGGAGGYSGDGGRATSARLDGPAGVVAAPDGSVFVADTINQRIRRMDPAGRISTFAGNGKRGFAGDGGPARSATFQDPTALALGKDGSLYVTDTGNSRVRVIHPDGTAATLAGTGDQGFSGDGGPATAAQVNAPAGIAVAGDGSIFFSDSGNNRVRVIRPNGVITTVAGSGAAGSGGDGGVATAAQIDTPVGLALAGDGSLLIADSGNNRIRRVGTDGRIATVAGTGGGGSGGDAGPATAAQLNNPVDVAAIPAGGYFVAEAGGNRIRRVDASGTIARLAGAGGPRFGGDGRPASRALLNAPQAVELMPSGVELLIADSDNNRVRYVTVPGQSSRLAFAALKNPLTAPLVKKRVTAGGRTYRTLVVRDRAIPVELTKAGHISVRIVTKRPVRRVASFRRAVRVGRNNLHLPARLRSGKRRLKKGHYVLRMTVAAGLESASKSMELIVR